MEEMNDKSTSQNLNLETPQKEHLSLLKKIFHVNPLCSEKFLPILISTDEISKLFYYLNKKKEENDLNNENNNRKDDLEDLNFKNKIEIFTIIMALFKQNKNLINLFAKKCTTNITYFLEPLIDLYLNEELINDSDKEFLEQLIIFIINSVSMPKFLLEYIYQKLSIYLRYNSNNQKITKLTQNIFKRYLNLLEIFYTNSLDKNINKIYSNNNSTGENEVMENIITNYFDSEIQKEIKNYIYFNGFNSKMTILLNLSSNNINCDFPTLEYGCSFVFWINLDKNVINDYYTINNEKKYNNKTMKLISFNLAKHQINLVLLNPDELLLIIDENESTPIKITEVFKYGNWNNICFIIYPKKSVLIKIIINGNILNYTINLPKNYNLNTSDKIDNITLFENLIGRITSILFCGNVLNNDIISIFGKSQGFYKIKYLFKFLLSIDSNYYQFSHNYKYYEKFKNISTNKNLSKINIFADEQNIKNIVGLFCPFTYDEIKNRIDDVFGNFIGVISSKDDGVNNFINYAKDIEQIGEINNLLPIIELMFLSQNQNKLCSTINMNNDKLEIENLLTEEILLKYMHIIKKIINGNKNNLILANNTNFFSHVGLFLEKFPSKIFTNTILNIFYEIGKEAFQYTDDKKKFSYTFVNMVLLNEKIFSKFTEENQLKLWDEMNKFFTSDYSQLKDSLNMSKICLLLRFYDKDRYIKYCCKKHSNLFKYSEEEKENISNIMDPDMNTKVGKLFETIQLYINKLSNEPDTINLFKLLSLDLSPCLQKKIIMAYQYFFDNHKIENGIKEKALDNLITNQFFEIFEYVLSISLLDVRIELVELFRIISIEFKQKIEKYIDDKKLIIMDYIGDNLLPDNLKASIENKENKDNKIVPLNEYYNIESYNGDIVLMWNVLNNWITSKSFVPIKEGKEEKLVNYLFSNQSVINIFIQFVSKVSPYYIDCLLILLYSLVTNTTIYNRNIFFKNSSFYKWLFEIIYFFHNKENEKLIEEKEKSLIDLIKIHSIELFKNFLLYKQTKIDYSEIINYILDYSYYLKKKNLNNEVQIKEITNITRILLLKIIESSTWDIDIITKACFEFMFLYKNSQNSNNNFSNNDNKKDIEEDKKENNNEIKDNINNIKPIKDKKDSKKNISQSVNIKSDVEKKIRF